MEKSETTKNADHARAVRQMFSGIAPRYDLLNHFLSLNIDKSWRRAVRRELETILAAPDAALLDVACGTGDLSLELAAGANASVIGTDFCRPMLAIADKKVAAAHLPVPLIEADALELPFPDETFDAVTIAFGLRNLADFRSGIVELRRVLKAGGKLAVLEFSSPAVPGLRGLFNFYFTRVLPRIGGAVSGSRGAYEYLPNSVKKFPAQKELVRLMAENGFGAVAYRNLTGGIAALHTGTRV